jgi:hypothetical protein
VSAQFGKPTLALQQAKYALGNARDCLEAAANLAAAKLAHADTIQDMIGLLPRLTDLAVDVETALRTARKADAQ